MVSKSLFVCYQNLPGVPLGPLDMACYPEACEPNRYSALWFMRFAARSNDDRLLDIECTLEGSCTRRVAKKNHAKETECWSVGLGLVAAKLTACPETLHHRNLSWPDALWRLSAWDGLWINKYFKFRECEYFILMVPVGLDVLRTSKLCPKA